MSFLLSVSHVCCVYQAVFSRQWTHWKNVDESKCRSELATVIENDVIENDASALQRLSTFTEVTVKCQGLLEKIISSLSRPFLVEMAEKVHEKIELECTKSASVQSSTSGPQQSSMKSVVQTSPWKSPAKRDVSVNKQTCVVTVEKLSENDEQKSNVVKSPTKQNTQSAAATDSVSERPQAAGDESSTSNNNKSNIEISGDETDTDSIDIDDEDWWRPSSKRAKGVGTKKPWSTLEEELVYKGVQKHGIGNWALIHANFLRNRSNVDIKDKWRTMIRQGRLKELAGQFGPLT